MLILNSFLHNTLKKNLICFLDHLCKFTANDVFIVTKLRWIISRLWFFCFAWLVSCSPYLKHGLIPHVLDKERMENVRNMFNFLLKVEM